MGVGYPLDLVVCVALGVDMLVNISLLYIIMISSMYLIHLFIFTIGSTVYILQELQDSGLLL